MIHSASPTNAAGLGLSQQLQHSAAQLTAVAHSFLKAELYESWSCYSTPSSRVERERGLVGWLGKVKSAAKVKLPEGQHFETARGPTLRNQLQRASVNPAKPAAPFLFKWNQPKSTQIETLDDLLLKPSNFRFKSKI